MKKFFIISLVLLILASSTIFSVSAENNLESRLEVSYTYDPETQKISIIANFVDITAKEGIIGLEYDVKYDPNILELVKAEPSYPKRWDTLIGSGAIEDLSGDNGNGVFHWSFVVIALGEGIKNDNELGIRLEFKPLKNESTMVEFLYDDLITEVIENGMTLDLLHVSGSNAKISIDFDTPENPNIDQSQVSIPDASTPEVSQPINSSDTTSPDTDTPSTPNTSEQFGTDEIITMPSIQVEITDGHISSVLNNDSNNENDNDWLTWALIIGGVSIVSVALFVFVKLRKGKQ